MHIDTGEIWTDEELQSYYTNHTIEEIREFAKRLVRVEGDPNTIAELSAKLAINEENLKRIQEEARKRAYRKLR